MDGVASLAEFRELLTTLGPEAEPGLRIVAEHLPALLGGTRSCVYELVPTTRGTRLSAVETLDIDGGLVRREVNRAFDAQTPDLLAYDPVRPEPCQRNRVKTLTQLVAEHGGRMPRVGLELYPRMGVGGWDKLRVLACDGPALLAWIGVWRAETFSPAAARLFEEVLPDIHRRLRLERELLTQRVHAAAFDGLLQSLASATWLVRVVSGTLLVHAANRPALDQLARDPGTIERLSVIAGGSRIAGYDATRIVERGLPAYVLITRRTTCQDAAGRLGLAARAWNLSQRQTAVLAEIIEGRSNKTIASSLGIAEVTVESHITAMLRKVGVESRAELAADFWRLPFP